MVVVFISAAPLQLSGSVQARFDADQRGGVHPITYKWEPAMKNVRFVGLDVHAETIAVAVAEVGGEVRSLGVIPNRAESVGRLIRKLGKPEQLRVCYEAGPTGYVLYWQLSELGVKCEVVAPTLVPVKIGRAHV